MKSPKSPKLSVSIPKISSPKMSPRVAQLETADSPVKTKAATKALGNFKIKLPAKKDKKSIKTEEEMEVDSTPVKSTPTRNLESGQSMNQRDIRMVTGLLTGHCHLSRHLQLIGIAEDPECRWCLEDEETSSHVLTECPAIARVRERHFGSSVLNPEDVKRIQPRKLCTFAKELPELPRLTPRPTQTHSVPKIVTDNQIVQPNLSENKSLVGSVTTWLPHNSKIVENLHRTNDEPTEAPRPQYLEILGGRKFLVIPKHNFMSVSPTVAVTATNKPTNNALDVVDTTTVPSDSASLGPDLDITMEVDSMPGETDTAMEVELKTGEEAKVVDEKLETSESPVKAKKRISKPSSVTYTEERDEAKFMENYLQNLSYGYNTLLEPFNALENGANEKFTGTQLQGLANTLKKHGTIHLDLRKMLLPTGGDEIWPQFSKAIEKVDTLRRIELCRCPASVVEKLAISNPQLEVINAVTIKCESMDLGPLKALTNIRELRLKSTGGLTLTSDIDSLKDMKQIKHLSLTSIRNLNAMNLNANVLDFPKNFGKDILIKLEKLEKLRLEKGQGNCHTFEILDAVKDMTHLEQLELVNFDIKAGFDKALGSCQNIKKLLIIPTYISQSATTNHMVLGEFCGYRKLYLISTREKEKKEKKPVGNGDSIPVLKPVPLLNDNESEIPPAHDPPLPTTRVKILKIPFHATWRQSITDSVN
ncbi:hypothetical protein NQ317_005777 [Molorchus minor]|uniref:Uncharacterized protein n=1 Tax=Molorchus minor TaxID=1323400 RepID=A0ABQ9JAU7_9CUCU|nr:hypothetical protein NQ317_005777 [Molorchus minor]